MDMFKKERWRMAIATGQISIIDYNDAVTLTGFINSNHPKTQMFNPDNDTYSPDWSTTNLVLTPSLFKLGDTSDIITSAQVTAVKWYEAGSATAIVANATYTLTGTKNQILTIKSNILKGIPAKDFICEVFYTDASTGLKLTHKMSISFSRTVNGGGITDATAWAPEGNVFKNSAVTSLKAEGHLWRGSNVDNTNVTYQWYKQDSGVVVDQGGGSGWKKLTEVPRMTTGVTTNTMTVFAAAVASFAAFKLVIKDTDAGSNTHNKTFADTITFIDNSDPIQVSITSTGGDVFKNGIGSTELKAKLFRGGEEIDTTGSTYTYRWYKYDQDALLDVNFGGVGVNHKTGKTLNVGGEDVEVKATFSVEVS